MFDPVLFESPMYEVANEAFLFCKADLEKQGLTHVAEQLEGLEPINSPVMGRLAINALARIEPLMQDNARESFDMAVDTLGRALGPSAQYLDSAAA